MQIIHSLFLRLTLLRHPSQPVEEHRPASIHNDVNPENPVVPPDMGVIRTHGPQEDVGIAISAVVALTRRTRILQVSSSGRNVLLHVGAARLARGRAEGDELVGRARDLRVRHADGKHALDKVCEGTHSARERSNEVSKSLGRSVKGIG